MDRQRARWQVDSDGWQEHREINGRWTEGEMEVDREMDKDGTRHWLLL